MSALNIRTLHVRIDESPDSTDSDGVDATLVEGIFDATPLSPSLSHLDFGPLAQDIAQAVPSLQYLYLEASEIRTRIWEFGGETRDGERPVTELRTDEGSGTTFGVALQ